MPVGSNQSYHLPSSRLLPSRRYKASIMAEDAGDSTQESIAETHRAVSDLNIDCSNNVSLDKLSLDEDYITSPVPDLDTSGHDSGPLRPALNMSGSLRSIPTASVTKAHSGVLSSSVSVASGLSIGDDGGVSTGPSFINGTSDSGSDLLDENDLTRIEEEGDLEGKWISGLPDLGAEGSNEHDNNENLDDFLAKNKHYIIMSSAGKPIYSLHGSDELVTGYTGIIQAIVSVIGESSELKSFRANGTLFVVSIEGPLILVAIDRLGQSEFQLRSQLDALYAQILSTLTKSQISKVFEQHKNFDLRQLLGGTEVFLNALTKQMAYGSPAILLGALECLKLRKSIRERINETLMDCRTPSLLYGLIVADARLVSVIRPRRHSLHPPDLTLLFSMLFNTNSFSSGEHWAPICLPRFNSTGYLYAYINFFAENIALVMISPDRNAFFELREAATNIVEQLTAKKLVDHISKAVSLGRVKNIDIPAPLIRHFLYKSKSNVQFVMPSFDLHFPEATDRYKLMALYQQIHHAVHSKPSASKVYFGVRHSTTALAWITPSFELYCVTGPSTKDALTQSVKAVVNWIRAQEERLFIVGGAVF